jgi:ligand-binding sensor domain-containing protein
MKKVTHFIQLCVLIFIIGFTYSCNSQPKTIATANNKSELAVTPKIDSQISEYIVEIFEDNKGNLCFGTISDGAVRFDGKIFTYFNTEDGLCDNTVASINQDKNGNMWFGTHNGASKYDGKTFTNYGVNEGLHGPGCNFLIDKKGNIWAGTNDGVFRFNGISFTEFKLPNPVIENPSYKWVAGKIWGLMEDKKGNIWFGRDGFGACKYDGATFTHFTKKDGLSSNNVCSIVEDNEGNIWFSSITSDFPKEIKEGGVSRFDGKNFTQFHDVKGLTNNDIYTVYKEKSGNVWVCPVGVGAYRFDGKKFDFFKEVDKNEDLIKYFGVQSILEDSKGTLWFGFSGGLFRFNGSLFENVTRNIM